jgi:hypothetical protein
LVTQVGINPESESRLENETFQNQYLTKGFVWNDYLAQFLAAYGQEIPYKHVQTGTTRVARFFPVDSGKIGRRYGSYEATVQYLGEEIAPR